MHTMRTLGAPGAGPETATWRSAPLLPRIDGALRSRLRRIVVEGAGEGHRLGVFAKVGDSITTAPEFLTRVACGDASLGGHRGMQATIEFFSRTRFPDDYAAAGCRVANSFSRQSCAAADGWTADVVVGSPPPSPPYGCDTGRGTTLPRSTIGMPPSSRWPERIGYPS